MVWCFFVLACEKFPCLGHIITTHVRAKRGTWGRQAEKAPPARSRRAGLNRYGRFNSTKIPVLISKVPRAQWNSIFRSHIPDASHRAFGYCSRKQDARVVLGIAIVSNGNGHFGPTYRNDQTGQSGPPSKVVPNIPVGPNRNSPRFIWFLTKISGILGWMESALYLSLKKAPRVCKWIWD